MNWYVMFIFSEEQVQTLPHQPTDFQIVESVAGPEIIALVSRSGPPTRPEILRVSLKPALTSAAWLSV